MPNLPPSVLDDIEVHMDIAATDIELLTYWMNENAKSGKIIKKSVQRSLRILKSD